MVNKGVTDAEKLAAISQILEKTQGSSAQPATTSLLNPLLQCVRGISQMLREATTKDLPKKGFEQLMSLSTHKDPRTFRRKFSF